MTDLNLTKLEKVESTMIECVTKYGYNTYLNVTELPSSIKSGYIVEVTGNTKLM